MKRFPTDQDPQRRPGRPRRVGQDDAGRGAAAPRRRDQPHRAGSRTAPPSRLRPRGAASGGISLSLALAPFEWKDHKINLIDTPGYADFVGDVARRAAGRRPRRVRGLRGRGRRGPDRGGLAAWPPSSACPAWSSSTSSTASGPASTARSTSSGTGSAPASRRSSCRSARRPTFRGVADLLTDTAFLYEGGAPRTEATIPDEMEALEHAGPRQPRRGHRRRRRRPARALPRGRRAVARGARAHAGRRRRRRRTVFPVVCGSATTRDRHRPARRLHLARSARRRSTGRPSRSRPATPTVEVAADPAASRWPSCSRRSPTPTSGRSACSRCCRARCGPTTTWSTAAPAPTSGCTACSRCGARSRSRSPRCRPATSRAVAKLADTATGDTLAPKGTPVDGRRRIEPPEPVLAVAIRPAAQADEDKLATALHRLPGRGPGAASSSATTRPTRRCCGAWARPTWRSRSSS